MMYQSFTRRIFGAITLSAAVSLASVGAVSAADNVMTFAWTEDVTDWNPVNSSSAESFILANLYEPLTVGDPNESGKVTPGLATEWSVDDSTLVWTFKLRSGVTFHDGTPFNAKAVKAAVLRTQGGAGAGFIWASVTGIETPSDDTVVFTTAYPVDLPLVASSLYAAWMYSPAATDEDFAAAKTSFGTGPYTLRLYKPGQQIVLDRNPNYWGDIAENGFDRVIVRIVKETSTRMQMIASGEADIATDIPTDQIASLDSKDGITVVNQNTLQTVFWYMNHDVAPTDNIHVRKAIMHLWDRPTIAESIYNGTARPSIGAVPADMRGASDIGLPAFDIEVAKAEIEQSGLSADDLKMTVSYVASLEEQKNTAILFQQNAAKAGLSVTLAPNDWGTLWANSHDARTASNMLGILWWPIYPTPSDVLFSGFISDQPLFNLSQYKDPAFDAVLYEAIGLEVSDPVAAAGKYNEAMQMLKDDGAAVFDQDVDFVYAISDDLKGVDMNPAYNRVFFLKDISR